MVKEKNAIDIVVTWVSDQDPIWCKSKKEMQKSMGIGNADGTEAVRFQDFGLLKYWFRAIEKYAPWARNIYLVVAIPSQLPKWLNQECEKLKIVYHKDIIDEKYLPTFNTNVIEWNLHRIEGLSERFIYFNDDMYLCDYVGEHDYFDGKRIKEAFIMMAIQPVDQFSQFLFNNTRILNKYFNKKKIVKNNLTKIFSLKYGVSIFKNILCFPWTYFTGFQTLHSAYPLTIEVMERIWELEGELLVELCTHRFRHKDDVSLHLASQYMMLSGGFIPKKVKDFKYYYDIVSDGSYEKALINRQYKEICLNDNVTPAEYEQTMGKLLKAFDRAFPEISSYETGE